MSYIEKKPDPIFDDLLSVMCGGTGMVSIELEDVLIHEVFELAFGENEGDDYFSDPTRLPVTVSWEEGKVTIERR